MNNEKIAEELVRMAETLMAAGTFKCPDCGSKVLENTGYCLKCKKKVKKAAEVMAFNFLRQDETFRYQLLGRMQSDCEYYLNNGGRNPKHLWSGDEKKHIKDMKSLYKSFDRDKRPDWISWRDILKYEKQMVKRR